MLPLPGEISPPPLWLATPMYGCHPSSDPPCAWCQNPALPPPSGKRRQRQRSTLAIALWFKCLKHETHVVALAMPNLPKFTGHTLGVTSCELQPVVFPPRIFWVSLSLVSPSLLFGFSLKRNNKREIVLWRETTKGKKGNVLFVRKCQQNVCYLVNLFGFPSHCAIHCGFLLKNKERKCVN